MEITSGESSSRRGRERGRRGAEVRERDGEREELSVEMKKSRRRKKKKKATGSAVYTPKRRRFARSKRRRFVKSEIRILYTRTTGRSVTRNYTSFLIRTNDTPFDPTRERQRAQIPNDTPFAPNAERQCIRLERHVVSPNA